MDVDALVAAMEQEDAPAETVHKEAQTAPLEPSGLLAVDPQRVARGRAVRPTTRYGPVSPSLS